MACPTSRSQRGGREFEPPAVHQLFPLLIFGTTNFLPIEPETLKRVELAGVGWMRVSPEHPR
jgi:hypothetical protein